MTVDSRVNQETHYNENGSCTVVEGEYYNRNFLLESKVVIPFALVENLE